MKDDPHTKLDNQEVLFQKLSFTAANMNVAAFKIKRKKHVQLQLPREVLANIAPAIHFRPARQLASSAPLGQRCWLEKALKPCCAGQSSPHSDIQSLPTCRAQQWSARQAISVLRH